MSLDKETVREIGIWTVRILLVAGAITGGFSGNGEITGCCITGLILSFVFIGDI